MSRPPAFIIGFPRSGTTLLDQILVYFVRDTCRFDSLVTETLRVRRFPFAIFLSYVIVEQPLTDFG